MDSFNYYTCMASQWQLLDGHTKNINYISIYTKKVHAVG